MDYYFNSIMKKITGEDILLWFCAAAIAGIFCLILYKTGRIKKSTAVMIVFLAFYLAFVVTITLINRTPRRRYRYNLKVFWTIRAIMAGRTYIGSEVFWNVVLFVPIGVIFEALFKHKREWLSALMGIFISTGIEVLQLITKRGLFEFDDIIYNTAGTLIGILLCFLPGKLSLIINRRKNKLP